jgi:hypothetical protein
MDEVRNLRRGLRNHHRNRVAGEAVRPLGGGATAGDARRRPFEEKDITAQRVCHPERYVAENAKG